VAAPFTAIPHDGDRHLVHISSRAMIPSGISCVKDLLYDIYVYSNIPTENHSRLFGSLHNTECVAVPRIMCFPNPRSRSFATRQINDLQAHIG
jgi:hypothetical protein